MTKTDHDTTDGRSDVPHHLAAHASANSMPRHHLLIGWWGLLVFLTMGLVLEGFHGFKVGFYLDVANETRRLLWTLAHAHGTLLALINIGFALTVRLFDERSP